MPTQCKMLGGRWRVCGPDGKPERNPAGGPVDGGGHPTEAACQRQAQAMNVNMKGKGKSMQ